MGRPPDSFQMASNSAPFRAEAGGELIAIYDGPLLYATAVADKTILAEFAGTLIYRTRQNADEVTCIFRPAENALNFGMRL